MHVVLSWLQLLSFLPCSTANVFIIYTHSSNFVFELFHTRFLDRNFVIFFRHISREDVALCKMFPRDFIRNSQDLFLRDFQFPLPCIHLPCLLYPDYMMESNMFLGPAMSSRRALRLCHLLACMKQLSTDGLGVRQAHARSGWLQSSCSETMSLHCHAA